MFFPHLSSIQCSRDEPINKISDKRILELRRKYAELATKIVYEDWLKEPQKKPQKLKELIEFDQRIRTTESFMNVWNFWRNFYFDLTPITPKNKSQLTCIENIIDMTKKEKLDLNMLIATVHKAHSFSKFMPSFQKVLFKGIEYYEQFYDVVVEDVNRQHYEEESLR